MSDPDITMSTGDTLELDTIIEESSSSDILNITDGTEGQDFNLSGIDTHTDIFDPIKSGTYNIDVNGQTLTVEVIDTNIISSSGISQEEDGELSEYTGNSSYYKTVSSPTISGSDYAISYSTDSNDRYIEAEFERGKYNKFSLYVYPENVNSEVLFVDSSNGNVIFGIYFRDRNRNTAGIYYSGSDKTTGSIKNSGSVNRYDGTELVSSSNTSSKYYHIEIINIDWSNETVDIAVDGSTVVSDVSFILSGVPDIIQLSNNTGSSVTRSYVDKIDIGE